MRDIDRDYYQQRLAEESERARTAHCDVAQAAHRQLAELYAAWLASRATAVKARSARFQSKV